MAPWMAGCLRITSGSEGRGKEGKTGPKRAADHGFEAAFAQVDKDTNERMREWARWLGSICLSMGLWREPRSSHRRLWTAALFTFFVKKRGRSDFVLRAQSIANIAAC